MAFTGTDQGRELALLAAAADQTAFEGLYQRWFQALYDFALHTVHDADLAADVLRLTYTRAWDASRRGATPRDVKAWLFRLAHDAAIDDIRHRSSLLDNGADAMEESEDLNFARVDSSRLVNPEPVVRDVELVALVWEAVATLSPKDYMLLDLHLRQGFTPDELADALGLRRNTVQPTLTRLRDALEDAVSYSLLRRGRLKCPDLDALLATLEGLGLRPEAIRLIERHLDECASCSRRKHGYPAPVEVFAALAPLPASPRLRQSVWRRISEDVQAASANPLVIPWWQERKVKMAALTAAVVVLAAIVITPFAGAARNAVRDPSEVHSTSHQLGQPSDARVIAVTWDPQPRAEAFAIRWSQQPRDLPDANPDLAGAATGATSPPLEDGAWYFHLRTEGRGGHWTSTVHLGPFVIAASTLTPVPSDTPVPGPAPAVTTASASSAATEAATATAARPSATTTPARSATAAAKPGATQTAAARATRTAAASLPAPALASAPASPPAPATRATPAPPTATPRPNCPGFGNAVLAATTGNGNRVAVGWGSSGGCAPYKGHITARYQQDTAPYASYPIGQPSGTLTDPVPVRCQGTFTVLYSLDLQDASGQSVSASANTKVVWIC